MFEQSLFCAPLTRNVAPVATKYRFLQNNYVPVDNFCKNQNKKLKYSQQIKRNHLHYFTETHLPIKGYHLLFQALPPSYIWLGCLPFTLSLMPPIIMVKQHNYLRINQFFSPKASSSVMQCDGIDTT